MRTVRQYWHHLRARALIRRADHLKRRTEDYRKERNFLTSEILRMGREEDKLRMKALVLDPMVRLREAGL